MLSERSINCAAFTQNKRDKRFLNAPVPTTKSSMPRKSGHKSFGRFSRRVRGFGDNTRFEVKSLNLPSPEIVYRDLYCANGQDEKYIKRIKNDLASDRTSDHSFLANHLRFYFSCAAYVLHQTLRTVILQHTELTNAQPNTVLLRLLKLAERVLQYKDRIKLQLPSQCPVKSLLHRVTETLYQVRPSFLLKNH